MLAITQTAVDAIDTIVASAPVSDTAGIRISEQVSAEGQPGLAIALVEQPQPSDQVLEPDGGEHTPVYIDEAAAPALDDKVLDAQVQDGQVGFVLAEQP
jgi:iron-sulfur cluster assembly protein